METAEQVIQIAYYYGIVGMVVAVPFLLFGIDRIEPSARGSYVFRPLLLPGIVLIWPLVLYRWIALERSKEGNSENSTT